jgi:epoxyqueuosine reductase QueG
MIQQSLENISIEVDSTRCRFSFYDPKGCKKCLEVCPPVVFGCVPVEKRKPGIAPTIYKLTTPWKKLCNGCRACIEICPEKAISITFGGTPL